MLPISAERRQAGRGSRKTEMAFSLRRRDEKLRGDAKKTEKRQGNQKWQPLVLSPLLRPFVTAVTEKSACQALHNAVQITGPLECTNVPQNMLNAVQLSLSPPPTSPYPPFLNYFSVYSADPLSLDWEDYHEGKVRHVTERGQTVDLSGSACVREVRI